VRGEKLRITYGTSVGIKIIIAKLNPKEES
jgi:hypothetical protein